MQLQANFNKLLFLTDTHGDTEQFQKAITHAKQVDALILGGDIPDTTQKNFEKLLRRALKANIPVLIMPGSHENSKQYYKTLQRMKNPKLIDLTVQRFIRYGEYELFFLPGSDVLNTNGKKWKGANFQVTKKLLSQKEKKKIAAYFKERKHAKEMKFFSIHALSKLIKQKGRVQASKRLVFSHIPCKCNSAKAIDLAVFYKPSKEFTLSAAHAKHLGEREGIKYTPENAVIPVYEAQAFLDAGLPLKKHKKNVGSEALRAFLNKHRITKFFCGHIHEAGRRAHNKKEKSMRANSYIKELFLNSGEHTLTELTLKGDQVKYRFIHL